MGPNGKSLKNRKEEMFRRTWCYSLSESMEGLGGPRKGLSTLRI